MERFHLALEDLKELRGITRRVKGAALEWKRARYLILLHEREDPATISRCLEIRGTLGNEWRRKYEQNGLSFLHLKEYAAREGHLNWAEEKELAQMLRDNPMRDTNEIRAHIRAVYKREYSRSGCIKALHRLGFSYKKPDKIPAQADEQEQREFIENYNKLQNYLPEDEALYFADAVHPDHQVRPAHGWFHKDDRPAVATNSGRKRVNIHGALCLETFDAPFVEVETVNADSAIALLAQIEARNKAKKIIHVIWDNAPYHRAAKVREWLSRPDCRIHLVRLPNYAPHLNPIERLWGVMHKYVTHNKFYKTYKDFAEAILCFLRQTIPKEWKNFRDKVTDNFRVISIADCKIIG
jgi:transposase